MSFRSDLSSRLRSVNWATLTDAYGNADELPGHLLALLADDEETRLDAFHELVSRIWHQGTVYPATATCLPFLVDLVVHRATPDRARVALILLLIAASRDPDSPRTRAAIDETLRRERPHLAALRAEDDPLGAVVDRTLQAIDNPDDPALGALLDDEDGLLARAERGDEEPPAEPLTPQQAAALAAACRFDTPEGEAEALDAAQRCLEGGQPEQAIAICERLTSRRILGELQHIPALIAARRPDEARARAISLGSRWLEPATRPDAVRHQLRKEDVLDLLEAVDRNQADSAVQELRREIAAADDEVFIAEGDFF